MEQDAVNNLAGLFDNIPQILLVGFGLVLFAMAGFYLVKVAFVHRKNSAITSYQLGVVAPVQYGDRSAIAFEDEFSARLDKMVEHEGAYDLARLLPNARELGAIAKLNFRIAPVLTPGDTGVLALIEDVVHEVSAGHRVLLHTSLETLVNLDGASASMAATRLSISGIDLKFAVVDRYGKLVMAVEHVCDKALNRQDCINRAVVVEVLRKAGVWYLEVPPHYSGKNARAQMLTVLQDSGALHQEGAHVA